MGLARTARWHSAIDAIEQGRLGGNVGGFTVGLFLIALYSIVLLGIGFLSMRRIKSVGDYFLGGRSIGPWVSAFAYGTTYFSAVLFIGFAGKLGWSFGLDALWVVAGSTVIRLVLNGDRHLATLHYRLSDVYVLGHSGGLVPGPLPLRPVLETDYQGGSDCWSLQRLCYLGRPLSMVGPIALHGGGCDRHASSTGRCTAGEHGDQALLGAAPGSCLWRRARSRDRRGASVDLTRSAGCHSSLEVVQGGFQSALADRHRQIATSLL